MLIFYLLVNIPFHYSNDDHIVIMVLISNSRQVTSLSYIDLGVIRMWDLEHIPALFM